MRNPICNKSSRNRILPRERIDLLFAEGCCHSMLLVAAAPGYGKTRAACAALRAAPRTVWLHLTRADNDVAHFWQKFLRALAPAFPETAQAFRAAAFPDADDAANFQTLVHACAEEAAEKGRTRLVVDDFSLIRNDALRRFFERLAETPFADICLVVLCSARTNLGAIHLAGGGTVFQISQDALRFTRDEIAELFAHYGLHPVIPLLDKIEGYSEGWPLAVHLLAHHLSAAPKPHVFLEKADLSLAYALFEEECFARFLPAVRRTFIKLSMASYFHADLVAKLAHEQTEAVHRELEASRFVAYNPATRRYSFHNMYLEFLRRKWSLLDPAELRDACTVVGEWHEACARYRNAVTLYAIAGRYDSLLRAAERLVGATISPDTRDFVLHHLETLPREIAADNPTVDYLKAAARLCALETAHAETDLLRLKERLERADAPPRALLGRIYMSLAVASLKKNDTAFHRRYKTAAQYLPDGLDSTASAQMLLSLVPSFMLADDGPDAIGRMSALYAATMPYIEQVHNGGGRGLDALFRANAAYNTFAPDKVREEASRAIYLAREKNQHDILCAAAFLLARIALLGGDYEESAAQISFIAEHIARYDLENLFDFREGVQNWLYLQMQDLGRLTPWIKRDFKDTAEPPHAIMYYAARASFLFLCGKHTELLAFLEPYERFTRKGGYWTHRLQIYILRAIGHLGRGEDAPAVAAFRAAYDMSYRNGIVAPFIEAAEHLRHILEVVRKCGGEFDEAWLANVGSAAAGFARRRAAMRRAYARANKMPNPSSPTALSQRERQILQNLVQGLTQGQVAALCGISPGTVKTHIKSIYNKLGATNRADAVRAALVSQLVI